MTPDKREIQRDRQTEIEIGSNLKIAPAPQYIPIMLDLHRNLYRETERDRERQRETERDR